MTDRQTAAPAATQHRQAGRRLAKLAGDVGAECAAMFRNMQAPMYDTLVNALGQPYRGWDLQADGVLWYLLRLYCMGELVVLGVPAGGKPGRDSERERNQSTLLRGLPKGLHACVDQEQHAAGLDGHLHLDEAWHFDRITVTDPLNGKVSLEKPIIGPLEPQGLAAPLEIGYTDPSRTFTHLRDHGIVARWPYGSDRLFVLALVRPDADLRQLYKADTQLNRATGGDFVRTICMALDLLRHAAQREHGVSHLPPDQAADRLKEIHAVAAKAVHAAPRYGIGPVTVQLYNSGDTGPKDFPDDAKIEVVQRDDGWTMASGRGVVAFAKEVDPVDDLPLP